MADEQVLTQEQIDAMLAGGSPEAPGPAMPPAPPPNPAPAPDTSLPAHLAQLLERVARLEEALGQPSDQPGNAQMQWSVNKLAAQLQEISSKVDRMASGLQGTVGFGAHETFVCKSCQSQGHVAARLNCTVCGEETWWGWWPARDQ